jgi:hypothetical protein
MSYTGNANVVVNWEEIYNLIVKTGWQNLKRRYTICIV